MHYSPLRYPGGKNKIAAFIAKLCEVNEINGHYIEPYSGGASVALCLLLEGYVNKITINDADRSIYAFWYSLIHETDRLIERIITTPVTVEEWDRQRHIQSIKNTVELLDLGFSTFFMNRTNRSGIILGGIIGGRGQLGQYPIDCRFNKEELIGRIINVAARQDCIEVRNLDALDLIKELPSGQNQDTLIYFDPPYFNKACSLYLNHYQPQDHEDVRNAITEVSGYQWVVSYDNLKEIRQLYQNYRSKYFSFKHTAFEVRDGKEVMFFSPGLLLSNCRHWDPRQFKFKGKNENRRVEYDFPKPPSKSPQGV
ncbi:MAG TPA: DNA methyltransferase [Cytophagales bacterium]|nr:DNA methyltransferase [Cytophagales bacterium]HAA18935.1 DNA methyltransferase [Cytophagales bacterium]HAP64310.1 DNA methyltransferase [Cytophagales bacterium]